MNRDVCEHFNPVDLPCEKCSVQKSTLREAAQQALEAMSSFESGTGGLYEGEFSAEIAALRAALAEPEDWELRRLREELERCKQTCAATSEAWREEAALAESTVPSDCADSHQPVAWYHVPHPGNGISPMVSLSQQREPSMYGAVVPLYLKEEYYEKATNSEPFTVYTTLRQRGMTCPSCEYNKARAQLWRHEAYKLGGHPLDWEPELMVRPKPLTDEEIRQIALDTPIGGTNFARAIERAHGIGEKE